MKEYLKPQLTIVPIETSTIMVGSNTPQIGSGSADPDAVVLKPQSRGVWDEYEQ